MLNIKGLVVAPFTAFKEDGSLDIERVAAQQQYYKDNGITGVFACGTTGEGSALTMCEKKALLKEWCKYKEENFAIIAFLGGTSTRECIELAQYACECGADAVAMTAPYYQKAANVKDLALTLAEVAASVPEMPFFFYHIPCLTNVNFPIYALLKEVDALIPNFAGIKYTFESLYEYNQCRLYGNGKFDMLHGQDETYLPSLAQGGAKGGICGTTNYNGRVQVAIGEAWEKGDLAKAQELQNYSQEVINVICHFRGNIVGGKRIMKLIGLDLGPNRVPWRNMTDEEEAALKAELEAIDFFNHCNIL